MKEVNDAIAAQKVRVRLVRQEKNRENLASVKVSLSMGLSRHSGERFEAV